MTEDPLPAVYIVLHGREEMPSFDRALSDRQIAAILSYARNAWDNQASLVSVEQVRGVQETGIIEMAQVE
jgi:mono/diheme cytochrome c family protein